MNTEDKIITKLVEMDTYLREKVATKEELRNTESRLMTHIDGFAKKVETFDHELVAMRSKLDRVA